MIFLCGESTAWAVAEVCEFVGFKKKKHTTVLGSFFKKMAKQLNMFKTMAVVAPECQSFQPSCRCDSPCRCRLDASPASPVFHPKGLGAKRLYRSSKTQNWKPMACTQKGEKRTSHQFWWYLYIIINVDEVLLHIYKTVETLKQHETTDLYECWPLSVFDRLFQCFHWSCLSCTRLGKKKTVAHPWQRPV